MPRPRWIQTLPLSHLSMAVAEQNSVLLPFLSLSLSLSITLSLSFSHSLPLSLLSPLPSCPLSLSDTHSYPLSRGYKALSCAQTWVKLYCPWAQTELRAVAQLLADTHTHTHTHTTPHTRHTPTA